MTDQEIDDIRKAYKAGHITARGAQDGWSGLGRKGDKG